MTVSVALQVERLGNSIGPNYKLDNITYSNAFRFHSSSFRFMSNVAVKWHTLHVYTLYKYEGESNEKRKIFFKFNLLNESGTQLYHFST
jgi:hypothetical protein